MNEKKNNGLFFPSIPKDKDYEDYIASLLACGGYYLERGIHCWIDTEELLELDIVSTKFSGNSVDRNLIEIKSGKWGYPEIFKVYGWIKYLEYNKASFIVQKDKDKTDLTKEHCKKFFNIDLVIDKESEDGSCLDDSDLLSTFNMTSNDCEYALLYRIAFGLEAEMFIYLHERAKSFSEAEENNGYLQVEKYYRRINSLSFFCSDEITRIRELISAFRENKNLSGRLSELEATKIFPKEVSRFNDGIFKKIFYQVEDISPIYVSLYIELLAKLELLKTCVLDYFSPKKDDIFNLLQHDALPLNVCMTLRNMDNDKYFYLYPYFWQVFIFLFGGFILKPYESEEYALLSQLTKIPIEEIPKAFAFFDSLFPLKDGKSWFYDKPGTQIRMLQFFPLPLAGTGVFFRAVNYRNKKGLPEVNYMEDLQKQLNDHTVDDMRKWVVLEGKFLERGKRFKN